MGYAVSCSDTLGSAWSLGLDFDLARPNPDLALNSLNRSPASNLDPNSDRVCSVDLVGADGRKSGEPLVAVVVVMATAAPGLPLMGTLGERGGEGACASPLSPSRLRFASSVGWEMDVFGDRDSHPREGYLCVVPVGNSSSYGVYYLSALPYLDTRTRKSGYRHRGGRERLSPTLPLPPPS